MILKRMVQAGLLILTSVLVVFYVAKQRELHKTDFTCDGTLVSSVHHDDPVFSYKVTHRITISADGFARRTVNGFAYSNGIRYTYNRTITMNYSHLLKEKGIYLLKVVDVQKTGADDIPKELEDKYLSFELLGSERQMAVSATPSGDKLFTTANGPFFMCDVVT